MDLGQLYQDVILEHNRSPKNWGELDAPAGKADGYNPMCGDEVTVWVRMDDDRVTAVSFVGSGCAISKASASMMTQAVKGKTRAEAAEVFEHFHAMVVGKHDDPAKDATLGKLKVFSGVARFPTRVKCASLAWHAMREAMSQAADGDGLGDGDGDGGA